MDYKKVIGKKVIRYDGVFGVIKEVDNCGNVHIKFEGDWFSGGYLYDPFMNEDVKFVDAELQKEIDVKLNEIQNNNLELLNKSLAKDKKSEKFYITKDNEDGSYDIVYSLDCDVNSAYIIFGFVVHEQQKEYRRLKNKWRRIRMYDSLTNEIIAQES